MYRRLTDEDKVYIISQHGLKSWGLMSEETGIPKSTMKSFYKKWERSKQISALKSSGRPSLLNKRQIKKITSFLLRNPKSTLLEIKTHLSLNCNRKTLSKVLKKEGFKKYKMLRRPKLTPYHRESRVKFARLNRRTDWSKVLFTDESSVEYFKSYSEKVWRKPGMASLPQYVKSEKTQFVKHYLKVWSSISSTGTGRIVFTQDYGSWSAKTYRAILSDHLKEEGTRLIGRNFIFQDDGDTVHRAGLIETWKKENGIISLKDYPPSSGDFSPIENAWFALKRELAKRPFVNLERFKENIVEIWADISPQYCSKLFESLPKRLQKALENDGHPTKY
jgi:transposase